jgi:ATP-dependent DNA helicase RecG
MVFIESETLELKRSTSELNEGIVSIVAILNKHHKGQLCFGIRHDGEVIGQTVVEKTIRDVSKSIADHIEPKIYPKITKEIIDGKDCILVDFEGMVTPYFAFGRAYIRVGDEDRQLSAKELEKLILKKNKASWEDGISDKTIKDVNSRTLREFVKKANEAKRINFRFTNVESTLKKLNLMKGDKLLKAAEVLFCNENTLEVQAAIFAGKDKLTFLDIKQFKGNLFSLSEQSELYIKEHINWRAKMEKMRREEIPEIPVRAITEAIINSLCHRDYSELKSNEVAIFKDRVEIYNPGQFPEEYEPEDFIKGEERSILRNPLIANTLYLSEDIERWGSGLKRIYEACKEENVKVEFRKLKSGFLVIFYRKEIPEFRLVDGLADGLVESQKKILGLVRENIYISKRQMAENLGISETAVDKNIATLKKKGVLKRVGPAKGGHWEVGNEKNEPEDKEI